MKTLLAVMLAVAPLSTLWAATGAAPAATPAASPAAMPKAAAAAKQATMAAVLAISEGAVEVQVGGAGDWVRGTAGMMLPAGSSVRTKAGGSATVVFTEGSKIRIGSNANFKLESTEPSKIGVYIGLGKLESWISKMKGRLFQARNPVAVASVRGTEFVMDVVSPTEVVLDCFSGGLDVTDNFGRTTPIAEGQRVAADAAAGAAPPAPLPPEAKMEAAPPVPPEIAKIVAAAAAAPAEPPPAEAAPAEAPVEEAPAEEAPAEETTTTTESTAPNPNQETATVSPSTP